MERRQFRQLNRVEILGKINGAVGNYNAHIAAYPEVDWHQFSEEFVTCWASSETLYTTQIEPHDYIAELFDHARFNTILIDFDRDVPGLILRFRTISNRKPSPGREIASTNPIDFETQKATSVCLTQCCKFIWQRTPVSCWQRDLTDSKSVLRKPGVVASAMRLSSLSVHPEGRQQAGSKSRSFVLRTDYNWEVLAEPIQTVMRR